MNGIGFRYIISDTIRVTIFSRLGIMNSSIIT